MYIKQYVNTPVLVKEFDMCTLKSKVIYRNWGILGSQFCPKIRSKMNKLTTIEYGDGRCQLIKYCFDTVVKEDHYVYVGLLNFDISYQVNKYNSSFTIMNGITTKEFLSLLFIDGVMTMQEYYRLMLDDFVIFRIMSSSDIHNIEIELDSIIFT